MPRLRDLVFALLLKPERQLVRQFGALRDRQMQRGFYQRYSVHDVPLADCSLPAFCEMPDCSTSAKPFINRTLSISTARASKSFSPNFALITKGGFWPTPDHPLPHQTEASMTEFLTVTPPP
jgi:hypothetical protein